MPEALYGRNSILEALRAGRRLRRLLLAPGLARDPRVEEIIRRATELGVAVESTARRQLDDVAHSEHHQGLAAYFDARQLHGPEFLRRLVVEATPDWPALVLCLDGVQDPQNLGALSRSAEALGVQALVLPKRRSAPTSAAAVKASSGALEHLEVVRVANLAQTLSSLWEAGLSVIGLAEDGDSRCDQLDLAAPVALVVGAEGTGLRPLTRRRCQFLARVPMGGQVASLNAAMAGSMLLYEVARQRRFAFPRS